MKLPSIFLRIALGVFALGVFVSCSTNQAESAYAQNRVIGGLYIRDLSAAADSQIEAGTYPSARSGWWLRWSLPLSTDGAVKIYIFADTLNSAQKALLVNGSSAPNLSSPQMFAISDTDTAWEIPSSLLEGKQGRNVSTTKDYWFTVWVQYSSGTVGEAMSWALSLRDTFPPEIPAITDSVGQTSTVLHFARPQDQRNGFDTALKGPLKAVRALWWPGLSVSDSAGKVDTTSVLASDLADTTKDTFRLVLSPMKYWTHYCYVLQVVDTAGNVNRSEVQLVYTKDSIPPAPPSAITATVVRSDSVVFSWAAATDTFASDGSALTGYPNYHIHQYLVRVNGRRVDSVDLDVADSDALGAKGTWPSASGISRFQWDGKQWTWYWRNLRPGKPYKVELLVTDMSGNTATTIPSLSDTLKSTVSGTCPNGWVAVGGVTDTLNDFCIEEHEHVVGGKIQTKVTWSEAIQACSDAGAVLCSGAQWERACSTFPGTATVASYGAIEVGTDDDTLLWFQDHCLLQTGDSTNMRDTSTSDPRCVSGWGVYDMPGRVGEWTRDVYTTKDTATMSRESGTYAYLGVSDLTGMADIGTIHGGSALLLGSTSLAKASARCTERNYPASSKTDTLGDGTTIAHPSPNGVSSAWGYRCCQPVQ